MISIPAWFAWGLLVGNALSVFIQLCKVFTTNYASRGVSRFPDMFALVLGSVVMYIWIYLIFTNR